MKDAKIRQGMDANTVNNEIKSSNFILSDDYYEGMKYLHLWECKVCKGKFQRKFQILRRRGSRCPHCSRINIENKCRDLIGNINGFEYVRSYLTGEYTSKNGKMNSNTLIEVRHVYCGNSLFVRNDNYKENIHCKKCCGSYENSFAYHIEQELGEPLEKYWDFEKNSVDPYMVNKCGNKKVWIKCQEKDYHGSYEVSAVEFTSSFTRCSYCHNFKVHPKDSFAQYHIDNTDKDFLEKYWDYEKNTLDPWDIKPSSGMKVFIKCQNEEINELNGLMKKDYHGSYEVRSSHFTDGVRCGYCSNYKMVHMLDSFGYSNIDKVQSWSQLNKISPFNVSVGSGRKVEFICPNCNKSFDRIVNYATRNGVICPECVSTSNGESSIISYLKIRGMQYIYEKTYNNLTGIGGCNLSYDFYLPEYNLLIEFQGEQHEKYIPGFHKTYQDFKRQQEHDKRKREYAKDNGVKLLEVWYWDFDNIEDILNKEI